MHKVLWVLRTGTVAAVRARSNELHGRELAYNTLLTFLRRLEQKAAVRVDKERGTCFAPNPRRSTLTSSALGVALARRARICFGARETL